jgi:hypothetical protein
MITDEYTMKYYDLIILGAGPSGLALAHVSSSIYRNILVIDKEQEIGGIHRGKRDYYGTYSECGPRIYMTAFYNFLALVREIGIDYKEIFAKYKYNFITTLLFRNRLSIYEKYILLCAYCKYLLNDNYGKKTILYDYLLFYKFSTSSIDIIDNLCVYIDEGNSKTYSLNKFIKLYDILFNSKILVSSKPQDYFLFNVWKKYLENRGVTFILSDSIKNINLIDNSVSCVELYSGENYGCINLVLAVPPTALVNLLNNNRDKGNDNGNDNGNSEDGDSNSGGYKNENELLKDAFGDYEELERWKENTKYKTVVCITYRFKDYVEIMSHNGLVLITEWGITAINITEYCEKLENSEHPILSVMVTQCDTRSSYNNLTANECCDENELIKEVYRQLKISYINYVDADYYAIINPNNYYDKNRKIWRCKDNAYYNTVDEKYIGFKSTHIENLYNLGTHNGKSYIPFNSIESAVSNGIALGREIYPDVMKKYYVRRGIYGKDIVILGVIILYIMIFYFSIL